MHDLVNICPTSAGPSVRWITFVAGARLSLPACGEDIVVIDDFWPSARRLRNAALGATFRARTSPSGFASHEAPVALSHARHAVDLISRAVGDHILDRPCTSSFVYETAQDEVETRKRTWVHYDRWYRIAVLYLVPDNLCRGGTAFYRHRSTGCSSIGEAEARGEGTSVIVASARDAEWEATCTVTMRFNRLVFFRPQLFHQAISYFGESVDDARLYNIFAFR